MPFLDAGDVMAGAAVEAMLREGRKLEFTRRGARRTRSNVRRAPQPARSRRACARRWRRSAGPRRTPAEWSPRLLVALRQLGWHGARALRSDEQQTVNRWHALLDEYSALGPWLRAVDRCRRRGNAGGPRRRTELRPGQCRSAGDADRIARRSGGALRRHLGGRARCGAMAAAAATRRLHSAAPAGGRRSSLGQRRRADAQRAQASLAAWRASTDQLVCSWARLEGDAHRSPSPLLIHLRERDEYTPESHVVAAGGRLAPPRAGSRSRTSRACAWIPASRSPAASNRSTLQAECGFRAYGEMRLAAEALETPAPGLDARERGMLLHKALELVWSKLDALHADRHRDARCCARRSRTRSPPPWLPYFAATCPSSCVRRSSAKRYGSKGSSQTCSTANARAPPFTVEKPRGAPRGQHRRRAVRIAHRPHRCHRRRRLRHPRLQVRRAARAALEWRSGARSAAARLSLAERGRNVQALANVSLANGRATFSRQELAQGPAAGRQRIAGHEP